jgi:hypothetical protein
MIEAMILNGHLEIEDMYSSIPLNNVEVSKKKKKKKKLSIILSVPI